MCRRRLAWCWLLLHGAACPAAVDSVKTGVKAAPAGAVLNWGFGLLAVLAVFFVCVWGMRKLNGFASPNSAQMRIIGSLSIGRREKIMLVQAGRSQLLIGVTPGSIQTLHTLDSEDRVPAADGSSGFQDQGFAARLIQTLKKQNHE